MVYFSSRLVGYFWIIIYTSAELKEDYVIEQCWGRHLLDMPSSFYRGQAGIVWSFEWLKNKNLIDFEITDSVLNEIDTLIIRQRIYTPLQIDLENTFFSAGIYLFTRYKSYHLYNKNRGTDNTILYELYLREHIIYLIDECERILTGKAYLQSVLLKEITPQLQTSILFFLKIAYEEKIFPSETNNLIKIISRLAEELPENRCKNIVDIITLQHLLNKKSDINETIFQEIKDSRDLFFVLSNAGFNSLLYNDPTIFDNVLASCFKYHESLCNILFLNLNKERLLDYPPSMRGLSGIGYGLLNTSIIVENYF